MAPQILFAGVAVARLDAALEWYERLLGRPPDMRPHEREAVWQVTETGWIYVVADEARAGKGLVTVMVDDLEADLAAIAQRGIVTGPVETAPGLYKKTVVEDPEGNLIQLGQALGRGDE
jgi:catechol 2,3-dioxygenase-like lactoylglutathione lyase family enzyme